MIRTIVTVDIDTASRTQGICNQSEAKPGDVRVVSAAASPATDAKLPQRCCCNSQLHAYYAQSPYTNYFTRLYYHRNVRPPRRFHCRQARCRRAPRCPGPQLRQQCKEM